MNLNWKWITRNAYTYCETDVRKYLLYKSLAKIQPNNVIRKNMAETESLNEWNELPVNVRNLLIAFVKGQYHSSEFQHWKKMTTLYREEFK